MREVTITLYKYDELPTEEAKEKARDWYRKCEQEEFGNFGEIYEPAETAARLLGIEFNRHDVKLLGGGTRSEPRIHWSLSYSQGDGGSFAGSYSYAKRCARKVAEEWPQDEEIQRIARELQELQRKHSYRLEAKITNSGREVHSGAMDVEITAPQIVIDADDSHHEPNGCFVRSEPLNTLTQLLRDFADWIYEGIKAEYEYRLEDAQIIDGIEGNEYDFLESGKRA